MAWVRVPLKQLLNQPVAYSVLADKHLHYSAVLNSHNSSKRQVCSELLLRSLLKELLSSKCKE